MKQFKLELNVVTTWTWLYKSDSNCHNPSPKSWGDHIIEWNPPPPTTPHPTPHKLLRHFQATHADKGILEICVLEFKNIWWKDWMIDNGFRYLIWASLPLPVQPLSTSFSRPNFAQSQIKGFWRFFVLEFKTIWWKD